jgi:hypothetical protein
VVGGRRWPSGLVCFLDAGGMMNKLQVANFDEAVGFDVSRDNQGLDVSSIVYQVEVDTGWQRDYLVIVVKKCRQLSVN